MNQDQKDAIEKSVSTNLLKDRKGTPEKALQIMKLFSFILENFGQFSGYQAFETSGDTEGLNVTLLFKPGFFTYNIDVDFASQDYQIRTYVLLPYNYSKTVGKLTDSDNVMKEAAKAATNLSNGDILSVLEGITQNAEEFQAFKDEERAAICQGLNIFDDVLNDKKLKIDELEKMFFGWHFRLKSDGNTSLKEGRVIRFPLEVVRGDLAEVMVSNDPVKIKEALGNLIELRINPPPKPKVDGPKYLSGPEEE